MSITFQICFFPEILFKVGGEMLDSYICLETTLGCSVEHYEILDLTPFSGQIGLAQAPNWRSTCSHAGQKILSSARTIGS